MATRSERDCRKGAVRQKALRPRPWLAGRRASLGPEHRTQGAPRRRDWGSRVRRRGCTRRGRHTGGRRRAYRRVTRNQETQRRPEGQQGTKRRRVEVVRRGPAAGERQGDHSGFRGGRAASHRCVHREVGSCASVRGPWSIPMGTARETQWDREVASRRDPLRTRIGFGRRRRKSAEPYATSPRGASPPNQSRGDEASAGRQGFRTGSGSSRARRPAASPSPRSTATRNPNPKRLVPR